MAAVAATAVAIATKRMPSLKQALRGLFFYRGGSLTPFGSKLKLKRLNRYYSRMKKLTKLTLLLTSLLTLSLATVPVYAQGGADDSTESSTTNTSTVEDHTSSSTETTHSQSGRPARLAANRTETENEHATTKPEAKTLKQTAQQQKRCEKRQTKVNAIRTRIADRGQKQVDLFGTIATRVETFYTTKGKTLDNYDQLVSDVNAKHDAAVAALATIKSTPVTLKCDGTDANGAGASFKDALKSEIQALKDYKTAVKTLIVGVKSVQSDAAAQNTGGNQ
jgi:phosphotransferase system HPr-like phosphotransfer protein